MSIFSGSFQIYAFNSAVEISTLDETSQKILEEYIKEASDKGYKRAASFLKLLNDPENIDTN